MLPLDAMGGGGGRPRAALSVPSGVEDGVMLETVGAMAGFAFRCVAAAGAGAMGGLSSKGEAVSESGEVGGESRESDSSSSLGADMLLAEGTPRVDVLEMWSMGRCRCGKSSGGGKDQ